MNDCDALAPEPGQSFGEQFFRLLTRISRLLQHLADRQMAYGCLTPTQLFFLKRLSDAGAPQPISFFADGVFSNRSNATQMIDRLEAEGLVTRARNPKDRRSVLVELTASGAESLKEGYERHKQLAEMLFEPLTESERQTSLQVLGRVLAFLENFQAENQAGTPTADAQAKSNQNL